MTDELFSDKHFREFNKLLEHYIFSVAATFIDRIDSDAQALLIKLFFHVGKELPAESLPVPLIKQLEAKVNKPLGRKRIHKNEYIANIERLIAHHQTRIETISNYIHKIDQLAERANNNITDTNRRIVLVNHYQSLKNWYTALLVKLQASQRFELGKLQQD